MTAPQVLIVGSGPSGLVLALALVKNGVSVRIIEKNTKILVGERGAGVMPRTLEIEYFLGACADIQNAGLPPPVMNNFDPKDPHRIVKSFDIAAKVPPTPAFPITEPVLIGQWLHQQILGQHLEKLGCRVELGCTLQAIEQKHDGVLVHLLKTKDGKQVEETAHFEYVVGADGAHSTVRKSLNIDFVGSSRDKPMCFIDVRIVKGCRRKAKWGNGFVTGATIRYTVRRGVFQLFLVGDDLDYEALKSGSVEAVQSAFSKATGRADLKVAEILSHGEWRPNIRIAEHFRNGRVFIIGDAAHTHPPTGGQGLNSGVQDSFNLAWKLALAMKSHASPALLDSYESERMPVITEMLDIATELFNKAVTTAETQRGIKAAQAQARAAEKDEDNEADFRGWKLFQLDVNYRWSEIVLDERFRKEDVAEGHAYGSAGHDIRAGDRAPDASGLISFAESAGGIPVTRLFDVFKPSMHTVLVFASEPAVASIAKLVAPLSKISKDLIQVALILPTSASKCDIGDISAAIDHKFNDSEGHAYGGYGLKPGEQEPWVVVVRPDAMIGAFVKSTGGVEKYLSLVFG